MSGGLGVFVDGSVAGDGGRCFGAQRQDSRGIAHTENARVEARKKEIEAMTDEERLLLRLKGAEVKLLPNGKVMCQEKFGPYGPLSNSGAEYVLERMKLEVGVLTPWEEL